MAGSLRARLRALLSRRQATPLPAGSTPAGVDAVSCEAAAPPDPGGAPVNPRADARHCGLIDMVMSGWCNAATSELFTGFAVGPGDDVLDVGCGDGLAVMFAAQQGAHTTFCDLDPAKVGSLSARLLERGLTRHVGLVASGARLPLPDGSMSRIIATEVLEHVEDPAAVLREMVRVGRPGALYLISVPDAGAERFQQPFAHRSYFEAPNHVRIIAPRELEELAGACGLEITGRGQWGFYWFLWMCFYWASQQEPGDDATTIDRIGPPYHPLLQSWSETWTRFMELPETDGMRRALNGLMPKSRVIVARRRQER